MSINNTMNTILHILKNDKPTGINRLLSAIALLFLILTNTNVQAQVYPVQVSVSTTPPYYNFLSHYGDQNNHLLIIATLTDFNAPPVNVRLRLKIEGQGYTVQTRTDVPVGNVFQLTAGFPVFIQGSDVLPLLQENALTVTSGNPDLNNLLEGFTTICVEVVEDNANGAVLATNNCTAFFLQLMQPPQTFLPVCNSVVDTTAMFQTFQWSPPQNYIPSIGTDLNYTFSLYEWIDTTNFTIFQTGQGLVYQTQTTFPMVQVSNFDLTWQQGVKYVWRVQAQLTSNGVPVQMITNNGLSAPCAFYYGKPQTLAESLSDGLVINVTAQGVSSRKGLASWTVVDETPNEGLSGYNRYLVEFRPTSLEGETWTWWPDTVSGFQFPIYRLIPERAYEVRVSGIAGNFMSEPSEIVTFTTPPVREYVCGEADLPYLPTQYQPLLSAHAGDVFQIGQFALEVTDILPLGQAGHFKGRGTIPHGFLGGARIKVKFDDLLVDREYNVREGIASAITDGVDSWLNDQYLDQAGIDTTIAGIIESGGYLNDSTVFVVVGGDSLFFQFDGSDLPIVIHGGDNVEYQFWPDGTMIVTTYGVTPSNDNLQATKNLVVRFEPASNDPAETNTFDKKAYSQFSSGYEAIICQTGSPDQFIYFVPNKSKALTGTAQVKAVVHVNTAGFVPANLEFIIAGTSTAVPRSQLNDSTYLLTLPQSATNYNVYAMYEELKLGKLSVKCYEPITKKVTIVPLVAMSITEAQIEAELNQIYKGANLIIDATVAPQFNTSEFTTTTQFANPDVNVMSKYTAQMRALRDAYLADHELESGTFLVFIVPSFNNPQLDGYMVRGRGVGFVAQSTLTNVPTFAHTLAHELGHGLGALQHAWGETESLKGSTDNLMDYSNGTHLIKQQWEGLRNPAPGFSFLDGDEDGSSVSMYMSQISSLADPDGTFTFIAVNGSFVSLPSDTKYVSLSTMDRFAKQKTGIEVNYNAPIGTLLSFIDKDDQTYTTDRYGRFTRKDELGNIIGTNYLDTISLRKQPTLGITCFFSVTNGNINTTVFKVNSPINQTTFTTESYPIGLNKFIIFEPEGADRSQSITDYIAQYHVGSGIYLNDASAYFSNSDIPIRFKENEFDVGKTISALEILDLNTDPYVSVEWLLKYLTLIHSKKEDYAAFESCFEALNWEDVFLSRQALQAKLANPVYSDSYYYSEANEKLENYQKRTVKELIESAYQIASAADVAEIENIITTQTAQAIANWLHTHNSCVLNGVSIEKRTLAFHKLLQFEDLWNWITPFLETIPEEIGGASSSFLESSANYNGDHWLSVVMSKLDNWNGDVEDLAVMFIVGEKLKRLIEQNPTNSLVIPTDFTKTKTNILDPFKTDEIEYRAVDNPIYFVKNTQNYNHVLAPGQQLAVNFTGSSNLFHAELVAGKVVVTQNYLLSDGSPSIAPAGSNWNTPVPMYVEMELKPYEMVSIVFLDNFAEECSKNAGDEILVPAYYLLFYQQGIENDDFWDEINAFTDGVVFVTEAVVAITTAPMTLGGSLAIFGTALAATNIIVAENREMATTQEIATYYEPWDKFYAIAGIVSAAGSVAVVSKQARMQTLLLQEASFSRRLVNVATNAQTKWASVKRILMGLQEYVNPALFNVGDQIAGKTIVQIRQGTNGKYAVVGRQMANHVNDVASQLQNEGKIVEILNDDYLNYSFNIEGQEWTVNSAWNDMVTNPNYDNYKDLNGFITAEYIELIPMYKVNKKWVEKMVNEGFTIIDIGYPQGVTTESLFYNMEISTINW